MPNCYDKSCINQVKTELTYCHDCQLKHYPTHPKTLLEKPRTFSFRFSQPKIDPDNSNKVKVDLFNLSFEQLKDREKRASEWLLTNKHLQSIEPEKWQKATLRYKEIVRMLNVRTPME